MSAFPNGSERTEEAPGPDTEAAGPGAGGPRQGLAGEALAGQEAADQAAPMAGAPGPAGPPAGGLAGPESELERLAAERDEYLEALRRLQAEFDNYRKRMTRQQTELLDRAAEGLLERLLPVLDAIDLALQHRAGAAEAGDDGAAFAQIASLLRDALSRDGLERIDAVGVGFDPEIHDAVAHLPADGGPTESAAGPPPTAASSGVSDAGASASVAPEQTGEGEGGANPAEQAPSGGANGSTGAVVAEVLRAGYRLKGRVLRPAMVTVQG